VGRAWLEEELGAMPVDGVMGGRAAATADCWRDSNSAITGAAMALPNRDEPQADTGGHPRTAAGATGAEVGRRRVRAPH